MARPGVSAAPAFRALVVRQDAGGRFLREVAERSRADLPAGELLVRVRFSSLNYKDALSATGRRGVTRHYPHTPGIDAAGEVVESSSAHFRPGEEVVVAGFDLGVNTPGGFGQYISVPAGWALPRPEGLTLRQCMIYGTAGCTAALSVRALEEAGLGPAQGEVLVTGATGGVGSFAVAILARRGYRVAAATRKLDQTPYLRSLGADSILPTSELEKGPDKALLHERWIGAVDTTGGHILAAALKATGYGGAVAACGNAASAELHTTVYPFILRGVRLLGIESSRCPLPLRRVVWEMLAGPWKPPHLEEMAAECSLAELDQRIALILEGRLRGRVVVNLG
jgi:acrylyl-CoA reductase (NADPH)